MDYCDADAQFDIQAWHNRSNENVRMLFVLVPSEPIKNPSTGQAFELTNTKHLED